MIGEEEMEAGETADEDEIRRVVVVDCSLLPWKQSVVIKEGLVVGDPVWLVA
jgi:hypothetical protein